MLGNKEIMAQNILRLMNERELSRNDVCDALGFKYTTFTEWIKGTAYPRIDKIEMMANFFGVQKKDLVEEYKEELRTPELNSLIDAARNLPPEKIKLLTALALEMKNK